MKQTLALRSFLLGSTVLAAASSLQAADRFWDGTTPGGDADGGTGTWAAATANWSTAATGGSATTFTTVTDSAVFGGTGGTVTLGAARTAAGITFTTGGYDLKTTSTNILTIGSGGITVTSGALSQNRIGNATANSGFVTLSASQEWLNESNQLFQQRDGDLVLGSNTLTLTSTGGGTISAAGTTTGNGNIIVSADTPAAMSGNNSYSGTTTIYGTLTVNSLKNYNAAAGLGLKSTNLASNLVIDGGTLRVQVESGTSDRLFTVGAGGATFEAQLTGGNSGQILFTGATAITYSGVGDRTITIGGNSDDAGGSSIARVIGDVGGGNGIVALAKTGAHNWTVSGTNTYSGGTTVSAGTLTMGSASALGSTSGQLTVDGGTLNMAGNSVTVGNLTGTGGTISGTSGARTLTIGQGNNGGGNYQGAIENGTGGTTALTKTGNGTITLSGTNTYTGATTVSAGTLLVNGELGNTAVTANAGTFGGTGTVGGSVTINSAIFSPGASPGSLEIDGNLSLLAGSTTTIELGGTAFTLNGTEQYDRTKLTGTPSILTLGGGLSLVDQMTMTANQAFGIFQLGAGDTLSGTFAGLGEGAVVDTIDGFAVYITYLGNFGDSGTVFTSGGNDIVLFTVPEPSTALLGAIGVLALLRRRRA